MDLNKKEIIVYALVILSGIIITYSNHFNNTFHFDDSHTIENNLYIKSLQNIPLFFKDATTFSSLPYNQTYRPLVSTTLAVDYYLAGGLDNKFYFHLSMFIVFIVQGLLMYFLFKSLLKHNTAPTATSLFASAWYMLHPACAETVNYIIARSDLISTFFTVLAFVMYLYSPLSRKWHLYLLPIIIGSFAKIPVVMFAPMLFVYALLFEQQAALALPGKENTNKYIAAFRVALPSFIVSVLLYFFIRSMDNNSWVPGGASPLRYLITQPFVIAHYFKTFFLPTELSADTDWGLIPSIGDIRFIVGFIFISALFMAAVLASRKKEFRVISFGICWFFLALIPTSSIIPFSEVMNDHRVFFPYVGLAVAVASAIQLFLKFITKKLSLRLNKNLLIIFTILFLAMYAYGTRQRNEVWKTEESLWKDVTIKSPGNARGYMNYGLTQMSIGNYEEAKKSFTKTLELWPYYAYGHVNMAILLDATGNTTDAEKYFKTGLRYNPGLPETYYRYGLFLLKHRRSDEARKLAEHAISISPAHINSHYLLFEILLEQKDFTTLATATKKILKVMPNDPTTLKYLQLSNTKGDNTQILRSKAEQEPSAENFLNLSLTLYNNGDYLGCIEACKKAIAIKPDYADAYNNICSAYNQLKKWDDAIAACNKAIAINNNHALAQNNLKWAILNKEMEKQKK